jgi:MFS family permease
MMSPAFIGRLALLSTAQFILVLDSSAVTVSLPSIQHGLGLPASEAQWALSAYVLTFGGFMMVAGRAADVFGRRRLVVCGLLGFGVCALAAGVASSGTLLIAARATQGVCGAAVAPGALALVTGSLPPGSTRARLVGLNGALLSSGFAVGVVLGAALTTFWGWRAVFFGSGPPALAVAFLLWSRIDETPTESGVGLDIAGAALATGGLFTLTYAATGVGARGPRPVALLYWMSASISLLAAFWVRERRAARPLLPLDILRAASIRSGVMVTFVAAACGTGVLVLIAVYFQEVARDSPIQVGFILLVPGGASVVGGGCVAAAVERLGVHSMLGCGLVFQSLGTLTVAMAIGSHVFLVLIGSAMVGFAFAVALFVSTVAATVAIADSDHGAVAGLLYAAAEAGGGVGTAIMVSLATMGASPFSAVSRAGVRIALLSAAALLFASATVLLTTGRTRCRRGPG